jgi:hypothetical protein
MKYWFTFLGLLFVLVASAVAQAPPTPPGASVPCASASLSAGTSSGNVALPVTANPQCLVITLTNDGANEVFYALGGSSVTATTSSFPLLAGYSVSFWTTSTYIAAITQTSASTLRIVQANGPMPQAHKFGGTSPPPPTCSNELDFSQACNSQYAGLFL